MASVHDGNHLNQLADWTVIPETDIRRAAALLIFHYGSADSAEAFATQHLDELVACEDWEACVAWLRIRQALVGLRASNSDRGPHTAGPENRVLEVVMIGFVAFWRGHTVRSPGGCIHYFPSEEDAWLYLGLCDALAGMPAIASSKPAATVTAFD